MNDVERKEKIASLLVKTLMIGRYNEDVRLARLGHRTIRFHFKDWHGIEWNHAEYQEYPQIPEELKEKR